MPSLAIPKGSTVLVTGANGYIGAHICDQLLHAGYKVRGSVRDEKKSEWMVEEFEKKYGSGEFQLVTVEDITKEGAFDEALKDCTGVVHCASNVSMASDPNEVIPPTIAAATNLMHSAAKVSTIKRVVYTSSSTALTMPKPNQKIHVDTSTWNEEAIKAAWAPAPYEKERGYTVYGASKTLAEQKCWEFVKKENPGFTLNTVLPYFNIGPGINPVGGPGSTGGTLLRFYLGEDTESMKHYSPQFWVNVQDTARLHLLALTQDDVNNERLFAWTAPYTYNTWLDMFRLISPEKEFPENIENPDKDLTEIDTSRSVELLKRLGRDGWTSLEESIREMLVSVSL